MHGKRKMRRRDSPREASVFAARKSQFAAFARPKRWVTTTGCRKRPRWSAVVVARPLAAERSTFA